MKPSPHSRGPNWRTARAGIPNPNRVARGVSVRGYQQIGRVSPSAAELMVQIGEKRADRDTLQ
jgi:hypothetical protein